MRCIKDYKLSTSASGVKLVEYTVRIDGVDVTLIQEWPVTSKILEGLSCVILPNQRDWGSVRSLEKCYT